MCGTEVPAASWYTALPVPDISDIEQVLYTLNHAGAVKFDAIYCDFEHAMVTAAIVAQIVGARRAMSLPTALLGRDKLAQKRAVRAAGLRTATVDMVPADTVARAAFRPSVSYPVIVKPVFGSGARGVRLVNSAAELRTALDATAQREPALCEEYLDGVEYHLDALICGGRLALLSVGRYLCNVLDTGLTRPLGGVVLPVESNEDLYDRAEHLVRESLKAFGITDGVVHLEAFDSASGLVFSECGFRRGGAKVSEAVSACTGTDYRRACCLASLGMLPTGPLRRPHQAAGWIMFNVEPGVLERMPDEDDFADVSEVCQLSLRHDLAGRYVPVTDLGYHVAGFAVITAPDSDTALSRLNQADAIFRNGVLVCAREAVA